MSNEKRLWIIEARDGAWGANGICKGELVRCGECKHGRNDGARTPYLHNPLVFCELEKSYKPLDWFCADGERKDGENEQ